MVIEKLEQINYKYNDDYNDNEDIETINEKINNIDNTEIINLSDNHIFYQINLYLPLNNINFNKKNIECCNCKDICYTNYLSQDSNKLIIIKINNILKNKFWCSICHDYYEDIFISNKKCVKKGCLDHGFCIECFKKYYIKIIIPLFEKVLSNEEITEQFKFVFSFITIIENYDKLTSEYEELKVNADKLKINI